MVTEAEQRRMFKSLTGFGIEDAELKEVAFDVPYAFAQDHERKVVQALEVISIKTAADAIELLLESNEFKMPSTYMILTAGMDVPENAKLLGHYGEEGSAFASFPPTDIHGHSGEVYAYTNEVGDTVMVLKGRAHPYEWDKDPYGDMVVAHPLQVLKEMARRQRTSLNQDPLFVFTYLTGVRQDQPMGVGDLGVILDDTPGDSDSHPGKGPRAILDEYTGARFQPKDGRASNIETAKQFVQFASKMNIDVFPAAAIGTPGSTEFQSSIEAALFDEAFATALDDGNFGQLADEVGMFEEAGLLFCMGITAELATMRQTFQGERDFNVLALGLATDVVGGEQSTEIDHNKVVEAAFKKGKLYRDLIVKYVETSDLFQHIHGQVPFEPHSIKSKLEVTA